jgi:ribosomal protein L9
VHRIIYGAMMRLCSRGEPIDQLTLTNELRSVNEFERIGGRPYVFQIVESVSNIADAVERARGIRLDRRRIRLEEPIKALGTHHVLIQVHGEVEASVKVIRILTTCANPR